MALTAFRGMKPFSQLIFSAFIVLATFFFFQSVAAIIALPLFGLQHVAALLNGTDISDPTSVRMLKLFQVFQTLGLFIAPSFLVAWLMHGNVLQYLELHRPVNFIPAILVILLIFTINPFINFLGNLNTEMHFPEWLGGMEKWMRNAEEIAEKLTKAFLSVDNLGGLLFNLFMIAILPALGEELLFRGVIQKILIGLTRNQNWGIWLSAILFSALHMQFFGFVPRMLLGAMFGYLLVWSGSLWLPILAHFINNAGAVIALYLIDKGVINFSVEDFGAGREYWYYALTSLLIGIIILWSIKYQFNKQEKTTA
jgi:uncharacterized protein